MDLLITGAWAEAKTMIPMLQKAGHHITFLQQESDTLPCPYERIEGVICNGLFLHHPIERFTNLKYVQLTSAGYDRVPMDHITAHNIEIRNARGVYSIPMAEFALCGVLQLYKKAPFFRKNQQQHLWEKNRGLIELFAKTVCIVGCGSVGCECALRFSAFGCKVIGVDLYPTPSQEFTQIFPLSELKKALSISDVVVLTLPLTKQTHHLFDRDMLFTIKHGATLVNIARGSIVDSAALQDALDKNHLFGAVLDVFEEEPLPMSHPFWDTENIIVTPHNSFVGDNNASRLTKLILENLDSIRSE